MVKYRAVSFRKAQITALYFSVDHLKGKQIMLEQNCTQFKDQFSKDEFVFFEDNNTTFYIHIYDFEPPLWIIISQMGFKVIDVNIKSCVVFFAKNNFIFGKPIFELSAILFHHNLLFFEIVT